MERELFNGIASKFGFEVVEALPSGIVVLRLTER